MRNLTPGFVLFLATLLLASLVGVILTRAFAG